MIKTVGFNLFIKKLVLSSGNFGPSVCFLICVCGTVKTATLSSRVMGNGTCSRASHAAVFSQPPPGVKSCRDVFEWRTSTGSKSPYPFTKCLSLYRRFARNFRQECKSPLPVDMRRSKTSLLKLWSWRRLTRLFSLSNLLPLGLSKSGKGTWGTRVFPFPLPRASTSFFFSNAL